MRTFILGIAFAAVMFFDAFAETHLEPLDVFQMEYASGPRIAPDGKHIVYVRNFMDIMKDRQRSNLWIVNSDGTNHRPLTTGNQNHGGPRWSPDGKKLLYASNEDGSGQLYVRWMDTGQTAKITNLTSAPGGLDWSPDGKWIVTSMLVPAKGEPIVTMPSKPEGAEWAKPAKVIQKLVYRADGAGYLKDGYRHLFVVPAEGGSPRQITSGDYNHGASPSWSQDSMSLIFSANRREDWEHDPNNSEVYEVSIADGTIKALTDRQGPDSNPVVSPDGKHIAYLGFDDQFLGYQLTRLYVMDRDGSNSRLISDDFNRSIGGIQWAADGRGLYFTYSDEGNGKIGYISLKGKTRVVASDIGGTALGRPYSGGSYTVAKNGRVAYTQTRPEYPSDVATVRGGSPKRLTHLNDDLFGHKTLGNVEEIWYKSSFDDRDLQGWIMTPPDFDPTKKYPLILEIHGGPFANYGDRFSAECQLYAAAGYVVLYTNPRGSTSYGEEFGNLIHHNYPGEDYDDLMSGVDAVIARGYIDANQLFVTGGSGGGILSAWIIGKTDRFAAAVVAKPVINWYSFVLTADSYNFFYKYWFPGLPWEYQDHYMKRSPLSIVGNVTTPTMLLTGERDFRTPMSESEQYYQALKLLKVDAALVRIPETSHSITARPSNLIAKVAHVLAWFGKYGDNDEEPSS
jgi:acylaminoacyl-peptidase